jgi:hypothetical protein
MNDNGELARIKARLDAPSTSCGGTDRQSVRDIRWLIALVESQAQEIEQLKSSSLLTSPIHLAGDRCHPLSDEARKHRFEASITKLLG